MLAVPVLAAAAAPDDDGPRSKDARELYKKGNKFAMDGDYASAVAELHDSFELEANALTLFAWAQATRQDTGCRDAVPLYQRFMRMVEEGSDAYDFGMEAIADCANEMADEPDPPPPEGEVASLNEPPTLPQNDPPRDKPPPRRNSERPWHRDPLGGVLVGVGGATAAAGATVLIISEVQNQADAEDYGSFSDRAERVEDMRIAGGVVLGVGGGLLIGGIIRWAVLASRQKNSRPRSAAKRAGVGPSRRAAASPSKRGATVVPMFSPNGFGLRGRF